MIALGKRVVSCEKHLFSQFCFCAIFKVFQVQFIEYYAKVYRPTYF